MNKTEIFRGIPKAPEFEISVQEAIAGLKDDVEKTQMARDFLTRQNFDLDIETRVDAMTLLPSLPPLKAIYEQQLFNQKNAAKTVLVTELAKEIAQNSGADDDKLNKKANEIIDKWFATLATLDKNHDGKLNYEEIIPGNQAEMDFVERVFGIAPFFTAMQTNPLFQNENPNTERKVPEKLAFVKDYITKYAATLIDPQTKEPVVGAGRDFSRLLASINLSVVGGRFVKNEDFATMWNELLGEKDGPVATAFGEGDNNREQEKFEKQLEKTSVQIRQKRVDADKVLLKIMEAEKNNPYGLQLRKYGDGTSVLIYNGSNLLITTACLNVVLAGFDPEKIATNPVMWATMGLAYASAKHFNPDFMSGTPPEIKDARADLKNKAANFVEKYPNSEGWLGAFSKNDLDPKADLGKLLNEKDRTTIGSDELATILDKTKRKDEKPENTIFASSNEAHQLYLFLRACQQRNLSPKNLLDA